MTVARWNIAGVIGALALAAVWLAWGLSGFGQEAALARRGLVGVWDVTELAGELPVAHMPEDGYVTHVEFVDEWGDLRVGVFVRSDALDMEYQLGSWSLHSVTGEASAWHAPNFRVMSTGPDEIELTEMPVDAAAPEPQWQARGTRRDR